MGLLEKSKSKRLTDDCEKQFQREMADDDLTNLSVAIVTGSKTRLGFECVVLCLGLNKRECWFVYLLSNDLGVVTCLGLE